MKFCAELAQREVEVRRKYQYKECMLKGEMTGHQAQAYADRNDGGADGSHQFERQGGEKGHFQHAHGGVAEAFARLFDGVMLPLALRKEFQCRQPLQHIKKEAAHPAHGFPLLFRHGAGRFPDQNHADGDKGRGEEQNGAGNRVAGHDGAHNQERREEGKKDLRNVLAVIGIERLNSLQECGTEPSTLHRPGIEWPERTDRADEPGKHFVANNECAPVCFGMGEPVEGHPQGAEKRKERERQHKSLYAAFLDKGAVDYLAEVVGLGNQHCGSQNSRYDRKEKGPAIFFKQLKKAPVNIHGSCVSVFLKRG